MEALSLNVLNGITFGMILFLIASGLSVIFGFMGLFNLAHGVFYILGAYTSLVVYNHGVPFILAALIGGIIVSIIGLIIERLFLSRLHNQINEQVLLTIGFVYVFTNLIDLIWGSNTKMIDVPAIVSGSINIGDSLLPVYRLVLIIVGLVVAAGLWVFTEKTRIGAIIRAGVDNKEMTAGLGVNYALVSSAVFITGAFVAGVSGFIGLPIIGVNPSIVFNLLLLSMIVIIVGGIGRIEGTLLGAVIIGLVDSLGKAYFPDFAYFTIYLAMILVLLVKPRGLLGRRQ